jgi:glutathione S-transferase
MQLIIGNKTYSSWSLRPWLLLRHFGVAFDERVMALDTPGFHDAIGAISPSRRVPALHHDGLVIWDSLAICEYANEVFLDGRAWPQARAVRAMARSVVAEMHSGFAALRTECPMNVRRRLSAPLALSDAAARDVARVIELWRECRSHYGQGGPFLFGGFSIADAFYAPVATRLRTYAQPLGAVEAAYVETIHQLPAMQQWIADAQREPERLDKYEAIGR